MMTGPLEAVMAAAFMRGATPGPAAASLDGGNFAIALGLERLGLEVPAEEAPAGVEAEDAAEEEEEEEQPEDERLATPEQLLAVITPPLEQPIPQPIEHTIERAPDPQLPQLLPEIEKKTVAAQESPQPSQGTDRRPVDAALTALLNAAPSEPRAELEPKTGPIKKTKVLLASPELPRRSERLTVPRAALAELEALGLPIELRTAVPRAEPEPRAEVSTNAPRADKAEPQNAPRKAPRAFSTPSAKHVDGWVDSLREPLATVRADLVAPAEREDRTDTAIPEPLFDKGSSLPPHSMVTTDDKAAKDFAPVLTSATPSPDPRPSDTATRERRQEDAEAAVNRMTLAHGVEAKTTTRELGTVMVRAKNHGDQIELTVVAERPETASLITQDRSVLLEDLSKNNVSVSSLDIRNGAASSGFDARGQGSGSSSRGSAKRDARGSDEGVEAVIPEVSRSVSRRVRIVL